MPVSTRKKSDRCSYKSQLNQSVKPIEYMLKTHCKEQSNHRTQGVGNTTDPSYIISNNLAEAVVLEDKIRGVTRIDSNCPEKKKPVPVCKTNKLRQGVTPTQPSRITNPTYNYRGLTINRFINMGVRPISICQNYPANTTQQAKDSHKS